MRISFGCTACYLVAKSIHYLLQLWGKGMLAFFETLVFVCLFFNIVQSLRKLPIHLIALSDNCTYSSLVLYQKSTGGCFSKVSCNVESETIVKSFSSFVTLKSTVLSCTLYESSTCAGFYNIMHWSFGKSIH